MSIRKIFNLSSHKKGWLFYSLNPSLNEEEEEKEGVINFSSNGNTFSACDAARKMRYLKEKIPYENELTHYYCEKYCPFKVSDDTVSCFEGLLHKYLNSWGLKNYDDVTKYAKLISELKVKKEWELYTF